MRNKIIFIGTLVCLINCFSARSQWVSTVTPPGGSVTGLVAIGNNVFAGTTAGGLYFSPDEGDTWIQRNGAFPNMEINSLITNGTDLFAGTGGLFGAGVYKSGDQGMTWTDITPAGMTRTMGIVYALATNGTDIYICSDQPIDGLPGTGIFKSSISGIDSSSWISFNTGIPPGSGIRSLKVRGTSIYAGTYGIGVWVSSTSSPGWSPTSGMASDGDYISSISLNGNIGFAGNMSGNPSLYRSVDNGQTWVQSSTGVFENKPVLAIVYDATAVYAGTNENGVMRSTDNGVSWTTFNEGFKDSLGNWFCNYINIRSMVFKGSAIFAASDCGVWKRQLSVTPVAVTDSLVRIYPNPARTVINLRVDPAQIGSICIIRDANRTVVLQQRLTSEITSIEINGLTAGIYFIQVGQSFRRAIKLVKY